MRYQKARRETRPEESGTREGQVSRNRVWSTTSNSAERSVKRRTERACGIWKHNMFLAGTSHWGGDGKGHHIGKSYRVWEVKNWKW